MPVYTARTVSKLLPYVSKTIVSGVAGLVQSYQIVAPVVGWLVGQTGCSGSPPSFVAPVLLPVPTCPEIVGVRMVTAFAKSSLDGTADEGVAETRPSRPAANKTSVGGINRWKFNPHPR